MKQLLLNRIDVIIISMSKSIYQYEKEIKKLEMSNKAIKREISWFKSYIYFFYSFFLFFIVLLLYLLFFEKESFENSILKTVLLTLVFAFSKILFGRLLKIIWKKK